MATERRVTFLIGANIQNFQKNLSKAQRRFSRFGRKMQRTGRDLSRTVTAPVVATAGAAVKAAADFESSFADIRKTVNATDAEFASMQTQMRNLAKEIPTSVNELNRLGGVAGQLGIANDNIVEFSKTIAMLGDTTDIAGEQAALSLSRFMNVMGTAQSDVDRLGSTVVGLGNNFAAMESEIVQAATSLAPLGNSIGLTEQQVLAFSTTIAASGGKVEAAGTAFQKTANTMKQAVIEGNENLEVFADTAGMSAQEFQRAFQDDAAGALQSFLEGLRRVQQEGGSTATVLDKVGLADQRLVREFGKVLGNLDDLEKALGQANTEWERNTALSEEAQQRYGTFNSKLQITWNKIYDLGIIIGNTLIPYVEKMNNLVGKVTDYISVLSKESIALGVAIGIAAAAVGPMLWGIGKLIGAFSALFSPMTAVMGLFAATVVTGQWFVDNWDKIAQDFSNVMQAITIAAEKMTLDFIQAIEKLLRFAINNSNPLTAIASMFGMDTGGFATDVIGFDDAISTLKSSIDEGEEALAEGIQKYRDMEWGSIGDAATSAFIKAKDSIIYGLKGILNSEQIQSLVDRVQNMVMSSVSTGGGSNSMAGFKQMMAIDPSLGLSRAQPTIDSSGMAEGIKGIEKYKKSLKGVPSVTEAAFAGTQKFSIGLKSASSRAHQMAIAISNGINKMTGQFLEGIGKMLAGTESMSGIFKGVMKTLANLAVRVGKIAIAVGVGIEGIKQALKSLNPIAAFAAGATLIALGSWAKSALSKAANSEGEDGSNRPRRSVNDALLRSDGSIVDLHPNDDILAMQDFGNLQTPAASAGPEGSLDISVSGRFKQKGTDLVAIIDKAKAGPLR